MFLHAGRLYWLKVYPVLAAANRKCGSRGASIVNILPLNENERITAILPITTYEENRICHYSGAGGMVKKSRQQSSVVLVPGIIALNLRIEQLIGVDITDGNNEIMLLFSSPRSRGSFQRKCGASWDVATRVRLISINSSGISDDESAVENEGDFGRTWPFIDLNIDKVVSSSYRKIRRNSHCHTTWLW